MPTRWASVGQYPRDIALTLVCLPSMRTRRKSATNVAHTSTPSFLPYR